MPVLLPLQPSKTNYRLRTAIDGVPYLLDLHWNPREEAHYLDLREEDETPILLGIKLVLGRRIGRASAHQFFLDHKLQVIDTSGAERDAAFDDLGARVQVEVTPYSELGRPA